MKDKEKEYKTLNKKSAENIWLEELNILKDKSMKWVKQYYFNSFNFVVIILLYS